MITERIRYRTRQFWNALSAAPGVQGMQQAEAYLNPQQMELFKRMSPGEQAHSLHVLHRLQASLTEKRGELHPDLATAALLHDAGKSLYPLRLWERVLVVLVGAISARLVQKWGAGQPLGWQRAFVIAWQHPEWGAQLAAEAGASPLAVALIRRHQIRERLSAVSFEDELLRMLQAADHIS
jgi:hypothetical protein